MSKANVRTCKNRILLLVAGSGIKHSNPGSKGSTFKKGKPLRFETDIDAWIAEAKVWAPIDRKNPDNPKRDKGNGWLVDHPLKRFKIWCFYLMEPEHAVFGLDQ